jgi:hypothetical protein
VPLPFPRKLIRKDGSDFETLSLPLVLALL